MITRYIKHGLSVSMKLFKELDLLQHSDNDVFFNKVWDMLKDGGVYIAPNGSTPMMIKDETNKQWKVTFDPTHPQAFFWEKIGCQTSLQDL